MSAMARVSVLSVTITSGQKRSSSSARVTSPPRASARHASTCTSFGDKATMAPSRDSTAL